MYRVSFEDTASVWGNLET